MDLLDGMPSGLANDKKSIGQLIDSISTKGVFEYNGWRIIKRHSSDYQSERSLFDCLAVKVIVSGVSK